MMGSRRSRQRLVIGCLAAWLFAFAVGVAYGCNTLASAHALELSQSTPSQGVGDNGKDDGDVGCAKSCSDCLPPDAKDLSSADGWAVMPALIVQTWTNEVTERPNERAARATAPPQLRYLRLML